MENEYCSVILEKSSENEEMYLKAIWLLDEQGKKPVHTADVARMLDVSLPSVIGMFAKLKKKKMINYEGRKGVELLAEGKKTAAKTVRNLRLTELLFRDILKIDYNSPEPCRFEHIISDKVAGAMKKVLGNPTHCPHGKIIPKI